MYRCLFCACLRENFVYIANYEMIALLIETLDRANKPTHANCSFFFCYSCFSFLLLEIIIEPSARGTHTKKKPGFPNNTPIELTHKLLFTCLLTKLSFTINGRLFRHRFERNCCDLLVCGPDFTQQFLLIHLFWLNLSLVGSELLLLRDTNGRIYK